MAELKGALAGFEAEEREAIAALDKALSEIPNMPLEDVPFGKDENDNPELRAVGEPPDICLPAERAFRHWRSAGPDGFRDGGQNFRRALRGLNKGRSRGWSARSAQFMLDLHTGEHGYTEVNPPILVKDDAMFGTAQLPKIQEDQFAAVRQLHEDAGMARGLLGEDDYARTPKGEGDPKDLSGSSPPPKSR